jgi:hemerythrin-like domain-containing protein
MYPHETTVPKGHAVLDEHVHLRELVDELRWTFAEQRGSPSVVAGMLSTFERALRSHFQHEEHGGYFTEIVEIAPRMDRQVQRLFLEHNEFAQFVGDLRDRAITGDGSRAWWLELAERFDGFVERFFQHEHAEDALLLETYDRDIGTKD